MTVTKQATLTKVRDVKVGDRLGFGPDMNQFSYTVTDVETTGIGMVRHQHEHGSSSYWPNERVYVLSCDAVTAYYIDRNNSGQASKAP